jgi:NitT/TauT family transport system substrate-binding protein
VLDLNGAPAEGEVKMATGKHRLLMSKVLLAVFLLWPIEAFADELRANGETLNIQHFAGTTGTMHAVIAEKKGFCEKYNFTCSLKIINSGPGGLQALLGKTIDVAMAGSDGVAAVAGAGGGVAIIGTSIPNTVLSLSVRNDVSLPNRAQGYPAIMKDFKGLKIGLPVRAAGAEAAFNAMLRSAGLEPADVTYVAVSGGPATAYSALAIGRQIDAVMLYPPMPQICEFNKTCSTVVDLEKGQGPDVIKAMGGSVYTFVMRREMVETNPQLALAFLAAMRDAAAWFKDPANFAEVNQIYTPLISLGDTPGAEQVRTNWLKDVIPIYSADLKVDRASLKAIVNFFYEAKFLETKVDTDKMIWERAP